MKKFTSIINVILIASIAFSDLGCTNLEVKELAEQSKFSRIVPEDVAMQVAQSFNPSLFFRDTVSSNHYPTQSKLNGNNLISAKFVINDSYSKPALYIFNFDGKAGFLMVSADSCLQPVQAFIHTGEYKKDTVPAGLIYWVSETIERIMNSRKGLYDKKQSGTAAWKNYFRQYCSNNLKQDQEPRPSEHGDAQVRRAPRPEDPSYDPCGGGESTSSYSVVGPLLYTAWGQACSYNNLCPNLSCQYCCANTLSALTGCVATALAQVIQYWKPTTAYNYNYTSMPLTSGNTDVQRLMRDLGLPINLNMTYGCSVSRAYMDPVSGCLKSNFGMVEANYRGLDHSRLVSNLYSKRPVILSGYNNEIKTWTFIPWWTYSYTEGHCWICDGYQHHSYTSCSGGYSSGSSYLHMNWGWHELCNTTDYNGWFAYDNWNISLVNGGNLNFQYCKNMVSEVHP